MDVKHAIELQIEGAITQHRLLAGNDPLNSLNADDWARPILVDLSRANVIDSSGINWLLIAQRRARESGGQLVLHSLSQIVVNVIQVLRMNQVFTIADSKDVARKIAAGVEA